MQVKARDLTTGDVVKAGGNNVTVTDITQRGDITDMTLTTSSGRVRKLTCAGGTRITKVQ